MLPLPAGRFVRCTTVGLFFFAALAAASAQAWAQPSPPAGVLEAGADYDLVPAYLSVVDGEAILERDGVAEEAIENQPLVAGDRLTTRRGRVEVRFDDVVLSIDENSDVTFLDSTFVALGAGTLHFVSRDRTDFRVDGAGTTMTTMTPGEYRVRVVTRGGLPELVVTTRRGAAEVFSRYGRTVVRAGYEVVASADREPGRPYAVSVARFDSFDRWLDDVRRDRTGLVASRYLPNDLRDYEWEMSRHGDWHYVAPHGYVWYPRVYSDWRPYSDGRWAFVGSLGWTWVGGPRWAWPTHHYGRWGWSGGRWYWIPGSHWAPAWVSWVTAPGYVGWCPLGFDNRPVISITSVTLWTGWTTVPSHVVRRSFVVKPHIVRPANRTWTPVTHQRGPGRPAGVRADQPLIAVPRRAAPRDADRLSGPASVSSPSRPTAARPGSVRSPNAAGARPASPSSVPIVTDRAPAERTPARGVAPRSATPRAAPSERTGRTESAQAPAPRAPEPSTSERPSRARRTAPAAAPARDSAPAPRAPEARAPRESPSGGQASDSSRRGRSTESAAQPSAPSSDGGSAAPRRAAPRQR